MHWMLTDKGKVLEKWQKRLFLFRLVIIFFLMVIGLRLVYLQLICGEKYAVLAEKNRIEIEYIPPVRGRIYDRVGNILATTRPCFCLLLYPQKLKNDKNIIHSYASFLSNVFQEDYSKMLKIINDAVKYPLKPIYLKKGIGWEKMAVIEAQSYLYPALKITAIPLRFYPKNIAPHLLGYVSIITQKQLQRMSDAEPTDFVGQSGLEKAYEKVLFGKKGIRYLEVDALGRIIQVLKERPPQPGCDLYLTLDIRLQKKAQRLLKGKRGAIVAMDPQTGEILASASSPDFDQNLFVKGMDKNVWEKLKNNPYHPLENRVTMGVYPPGSLLKIVTAIAALEEKIISPFTRIYCSGSFSLGNRKFRCWKRVGHGFMNVKTAIRESCDVFFYQLGLWLGPKKIAQYAIKCGFGQPTGIEINEVLGLVPTPQWYQKTKGKPWPKGETLNMAIGQGAFLVTPLQLIQFFSAIANGGYIYKPILVKKIVLGEKTIKEMRPKIKGKLPVSAKNLEIIRNAMIEVMNHPLGTGFHARSHKITIAGKTGTAQLTSLERIKRKKIKDHALFAGFAPAKDPKIAIVVIIEHGGKGGIIAAPMAKTLIEAYLNGKN